MPALQCRKGRCTASVLVVCALPGNVSMPSDTVLTGLQPGEFAAVVGSSQCVPCRKGFITAAFASENCQPCPRATFAVDVGLTACTNCSAGSAAFQSASAACVPCGVRLCDRPPFLNSLPRVQAGSFAKYQGASVCQSCPPGQRQKAEGQTACEPCAQVRTVTAPPRSCFPWRLQGKFSALSQSADCFVCGPVSARQ